jgi:hypothetical protein
VKKNYCNTDEFAAAMQVKATSVRVRLCQTGSYFGIKPEKLPNGRLLWPVDALEKFLSGEGNPC